jgi:hypothetical protein
MKNKQIVITIVGIVLVGVLAFFGGMQYQKMQSVKMVMNTTMNGGGRNMAFGAGQGRMSGTRAQGIGMTMGEITSIDASSVTVKLQDGSSKIINLQSSTTYNKAEEGSKNDLKTGERIAVFGNTASDGSITAESVQLNPMMRMMQSAGQSSTKPAN